MDVPDDEPQLGEPKHSYRRRWLGRGLSDALNVQGGLWVTLAALFVPLLVLVSWWFFPAKGTPAMTPDEAVRLIGVSVFLFLLAIVWQLLRAPGRIDRETRDQAAEVVRQLEERAASRQLQPSYSASGDLIVVNVRSTEEAVAVIGELHPTVVSVSSPATTPAPQEIEPEEMEL